MDSLTKNDLVDAIVEEMSHEHGVLVDELLVKQVLASLEAIVADEIAEGVAITVPGIVKLTPGFIAAKPKRWGVNRFDPDRFDEDGNEMEQEYAAKPASTKLRATPARGLKDALPTARSAAGQRLAKVAAKRSRNGRR